MLAGLAASSGASCAVPDAAAQRGAGERVVLRAENESGVPVHPSEHGRELSGRIPDATRVSVVRWGAGRRWLEVRAPDGASGWISARYVAPEVPSEPTGPWASPAACRAALIPSRPTDRVRLASWNLRWFPDGSSGGPSAHPTDVRWAACAIASLGADAVALQEILLHERGLAAVQELTRELGRLTGGRWVARFDECPRDGRQHVGWLVDESRARIRSVTQLGGINPSGGCHQHLRPGLAVDLGFGGGLDLFAIVVHLDSGVEARDHGHRAQSLDAIAPAIAELRRGRREDDVVVLGDFNTMGCSSCAPTISALEELAALDARVRGLGLARVPSDVACSEYYRGGGVLLDHALVTQTTSELARGARLEVAGPCAEQGCRLGRGVAPAALEQLSDHCPIVVELRNQDLD